MKEKKVIDYTRTYRRIEADKNKCILYQKRKVSYAERRES